jgi:hypothetical protein
MTVGCEMRMKCCDTILIPRVAMSCKARQPNPSSAISMLSTYAPDSSQSTTETFAAHCLGNRKSN